MIRANSLGEWLTHHETYAFRAAPGPGEFSSITPVLQLVFYPAQPILVRAMRFWGDSGDVMVFAGGATSLLTRLSDGVSGFATIVNMSAAQVNGGYTGSGYLWTPGATSPYMEFYPTGYWPNNPQTNVGLGVASDAGTITGILHAVYEYKILDIRAGRP